MVVRLIGRFKSSAHVDVLGYSSILWAAMCLQTDMSFATVSVSITLQKSYIPPSTLSQCFSTAGPGPGTWP